MRSNPGKRVTIYEIATLVHETHLLSIIPWNILSGFSSTGNWPNNPNVFCSDFVPVVVTDNDFVPVLTDKEKQTNFSFYVSPANIMPLPKVTPIKRQVG